MERVERHLSRRLTNGLSSQNTNHLTRSNRSLEETLLKFTEDVIKCFLVETVLDNKALEGKTRS